MTTNLRTIKIIKTLMLLIVVFFMFQIVAFAEDGQIVIAETNFGGRIPEAWKIFMGEWGSTIAGISGVATITSFLVLLIQIMMLPAMSSHPIKKRQAMLGMMWSMITVSIIGGLSTVLSLLFTIMYT